MNDRTFQYMLRYTIAPGVCEDERIEEMVAYCVKNGIDDVMLVTCGEHLNTGHITPEEWETIWLPLFEKVKAKLQPHGITASINPWTTTLHCDRGRFRKEGQNFRHMVDPTGREATAVACPADEDFLDYVADMYRRYAEANPHTLWLEDDMRLHNHAPLTWGGCFCDYHMRLFSEALGRTVTREEFIEAAVAEGEPSPCRQVWLDSAREAICRIAERIGEAVFAVNPDIQLGLMCSAPAVHAAEGRDWARMMKALTGNKCPLVRPHLPSYSEESTNFYSELFTTISRQTAALVPANVEIRPELENCPWTRFYKSRRFTDFQIKSAALLPSTGITMNIYDMMGNGMPYPEQFGGMLREARPFLDAVCRLDLKPDESRGVTVPIFEKSAYTLHTHAPQGMPALYPRDSLFSPLLSAFSISNHMLADKLPSSGVVAFSGQSIRGYNDAELDCLFAENRVIVDGEAVLALADRGRLDLIGAVSATVAELPEGDRAMEECLVPILGRDRMRMGIMDDAGDLLRIEYARETAHKTLAVAVKPDGTPVLDTITQVGEKVLILPWAHYPHDFAQRRSDVLLEILQGFIGGDVVYTKEPHLHLYEYTTGDGDHVLALVNLSGDDYEDVTFYTADAAAIANATLITPEAPNGVPAPIETIAPDRFVLHRRIDRLAVELLKW
ncbi:MAG: hypothetical protein IJC17_00435 [Clostridia bacterium]|nr:hypothetical protein [Clostridia bacterium]